MTSLALGVVVHPRKDVRESLRALQRWLAGHDAVVVGRLDDRARLAEIEAVELLDDASFAQRVQGVVSLGGDGTMLGAMRLVARRPVPVIGINHGTLGFLVEVSPEHVDDALSQLERGEFSIEPHAGLVVTGAGSLFEPGVAFNDVVVARAGRRAAVSVDLQVNGERYGYYRCDALIVSTPTGSTAYSYAAGGPVLSPSADAVVVTPVVAMAGISRPVVFAADDEVTLGLVDDERGSVEVDVDGVAAGTVLGPTVEVRRTPEPAQVVRLDAGSHARRSRVKLSLLDLPLRPDQLLELVPPGVRRHETT